jgi:hypothetical protein
MKTTILAIVAVLFLSIGSYSQQRNEKSVNNSVNPGVNLPDNMVINDINHIYKLISFTVSSSHVGNQWTTHLIWTAVGETQITSYEIDRMMSTNLGIWSAIAKVHGSNNNALITRNYFETFTVTNPLTVFYRLKIYFVNGSVQYSQIIYVAIG